MRCPLTFAPNAFGLSFFPGKHAGAYAFLVDRTLLYGYEVSVVEQ